MLIKNNKFIINYNGKHSFYMQSLLNELTKKYSIIQELYKSKAYLGVINIYLFDTKEEYDDFCYDIDSLETPIYSTGSFTRNSVRYCFDNYDLSKGIDPFICGLLHELIHLNNINVYGDELDRVLWLDEGIAQLFSGKYDILRNNEEIFLNFLTNIINREKEIPKIEYLKKHGTNYGEFIDMDHFSYNGYKISYLLVRYLFEKGIDLISLLAKKDEIKDIEKNIMTEAINYYIDNYLDKEYLYDIEKISTPRELLHYLNYNFKYGWFDKNKKEHLNTLANHKEELVIASVDFSIKHRVGSCIEQTAIEKQVLERLGYKTRIFFKESLQNEKVIVHTFVIYKNDDTNKWVYFEHSNPNLRGIRAFDTIDDVLFYIDQNSNSDNESVYTEIADIPTDINYENFIDYVHVFGKNHNKIRG